MRDKVRIAATGAGVAYYPEFVARELGYFEAEDLDVETTVPGLGPWVARALTARTAEVALGGIWRPLMYRGRLATLYAFAQLCDRCPFLLLSRRPAGSFEWRQLIDRTVIVPDGAPSPWILLQGILRQTGTDVGRIRFLQQVQRDEAVELFRAGRGRPGLVAVQARVFVGSFPTVSMITAARDAGASHAPSLSVGGTRR